jgi:inward rectifier potassium channel
MPPLPPPSAASERRLRYRSKTPVFRAVHTRGQAFELGGDLYFALLTRPLWQFCLAVAVLVLGLNALFAELYMLDAGGVSNVRLGSFEDAFFFSVQTLATIGYGAMAPQSRFAHVMVTIESILGVLAVGSLAGVAFARLSRPKARVVFTDKMVIRPRNGVPHLQLRMANWRTNLIVEASLRLYLLVTQRTAEGEVLRTPVELKLVRAYSPIFFLTWTAMHAIDETSPFFGDGTIERLRAEGAQLFVSLSGYDESLGTVVHAYADFKLDEIVKDAAFVDVVTVNPDGSREIDFAHFQDIVPLERA